MELTRKNRTWNCTFSFPEKGKLYLVQERKPPVSSQATKHMECKPVEWTIKWERKSQPKSIILIIQLLRFLLKHETIIYIKHTIQLVNQILEI